MHSRENAQVLHRQALKAAKNFFRAEAELLEVLQKIDASRAYRDLGRTSLFDYAVNELKLSESTALNFINVARKAREVPALQAEIAQGHLSVSKARKIVPVVTAANQAEWIARAKALSSRSLEKEVARIVPQTAHPERVKYLTESRVSLSLSLDEKTLEALKRVQDLESQRLSRAVSFEETLAVLTALYQERKDPLARAERIGGKEKRGQAKWVAGVGVKDGPKRSDVTGQVKLAAVKASLGRRPLPARVKRQVVLRDQARCTDVDANGRRCEQRRWLEIHHLAPVSRGGSDDPENLATLCFAHHRIRHSA